jgi:hypothetical protein
LQIAGAIGSARPRSRDGAEGHDLTLNPHERFGRRSGELKVAAVKIEEIRRWVDSPQAPVDAERIARERRGEALREHNLEDVARGNVLLALAHRVFVGGTGKVRARPSDAGRCRRPGHGARKPGRRLFRAGQGVVVGRATRVAGVPVGHEDESMHDVIEHEHRVVPRQPHFGQSRVRAMATGKSFALTHDVVAEHPNGTAGERRNVGELHGVNGRRQFL